MPRPPRPGKPVRSTGAAAPWAAGEAHARAGRRFQQEYVGLLPLDPLARADRPVAEPQEQELE